MLGNDYGLDKKIVRVRINVYTNDSDKKFNDAAIKIRIRKDCQQEILQNLNKININHETLFPGIG
jgi:hypothetical protein